MANQSRNVIGQQIELPFSESLRISYQSLMIRFGRSVITTAGITLGIAFLIFVVISNEVSLSTSAGSTSEQIMDLGEEKETGISTSSLAESTCSSKQKQSILLKYFPACNGVTLKTDIVVISFSVLFLAV